MADFSKSRRSTNVEVAAPDSQRSNMVKLAAIDAAKDKANSGKVQAALDAKTDPNHRISVRGATPTVSLRPLHTGAKVHDQGLTDSND